MDAVGPGVEDLEAALRPAWVDVDLAALEHNLARIRERLGPSGARVMAVVKADAYGHGAAGVSRALEEAGVDWLGVALLEEGAELRRAGALLAGEFGQSGVLATEIADALPRALREVHRGR